MSLENVKITDLQKIPGNDVEESDLLLLSHPVDNKKYDSVALSALGLGNAITKFNLSVSGEWTFENNAKQNTKFETDEFIEQLANNNLSSIIEDNKDGWYKKLPTSILQKNDISSIQSISVDNNTIPNIDFVQRIVAGAFQELKNIIQSSYIPSHVGQIIMSTKLSNIDAVKAKYGDFTSWIRHSGGYFLRGAGEEDIVKSSNNKSDGGSNTSTFSISENSLPPHTHGLTNAQARTSVSGKVKNVVTNIKTTTVKADGVVNNQQAVYPLLTAKPSTSDISISSGSVSFNSATTDSTGNNVPITIQTLPAYKNVYIWERID